jgi:hypothetical protein
MISDNIKNLTTEEYRLLQSTQDRTRWTEFYGLPDAMYYPVQAPISSKRKGDIWEDKIRASSGLLEKQDETHDATLDSAVVKLQNLRGARVEIKYTVIAKGDSTKAIEKRGYALEAGARTKKLVKNPLATKGYNYIGGGTFQQIHPDKADYGLFSAVFGNGAVHYWVPYHLISTTAGADNFTKGMIPLQSQHRGHTTEGQISRPEKFHDLFLLDITWETPFLTDLSKYDLSKYENLVY